MPSGTCAASDNDTWSGAAATLGPGARPGLVDEDVAHDLRRHGEEVRAILPADALPVHQPQVGLIDERRRLKDVSGPLARHVARGETMQLLLDERRQDVERALVAAAPRDEQLRDIPSRTHPSSNRVSQ